MNNDKLNSRLFIQKFCSTSPILCFDKDTKEEFVMWKSEVSARLKASLGFDLLESCSLSPQLTDEILLTTKNGVKYRREHWYIDTLHNLSLGMYVLCPENSNGKAALALHGHGCDGKNGLVGIVCEEIAKNIEKYNYTYAFELLEMGYTVFCPDLLGSGNRRISDTNPEQSDCTNINNALNAVGLSLHSISVYELIKCVDFISDYNINSEDLVCVGFSGGGHCALWLSALDERIKTTYISGFFHSLKSTLYESNFCSCNFFSNYWNFVELDTLAMMIAPRRLFIETGKNDKLNKLENVYPLIENTQRIYNLYNSDNFHFTVCEGAHQWFGNFNNKI